MQVILVEDVKALGKRGAVVKVSDGFARNFLFPKKLALEATEGNLRNLEHVAQVQQTKKTREVDHARAAANELLAHPIKLVARAGDKGKLYGAITNQDIADALARVTSWPIDKRKIVLKEPIKRVGAYTVKIRLHADVAPEVTVHVVGSQEAEIPAATTP